MNIKENSVVQMHYTLKDTTGAILDSSEGRVPLTYMHGKGFLIHGLEKQIEGKASGDKFNAKVPAIEAYGEYNEEMLQVVPKSGFQGDDELKEGMQVQVQTTEGTHIALVKTIEGEDVTLDMNHPLAGQDLEFDVEIIDVREATPEEIDHGHVHDPDGHHH